MLSGEIDVGHIYEEITVRPLGGSTTFWKGMAIVDTEVIDTFLPARVLRELEIQPLARRSYEIANGTERRLPIGFGAIEVRGRLAGGTLVFTSDEWVPLLGGTVVLSTGWRLDPQQGRLIPRCPKRKRC
jgi:hypothetical protein